MILKNLGEIFQAYPEFAIGAFNAFNYETTAGIVKAGEDLKKPVIVQFSARVVKFYGPKIILSMVNEIAAKSIIPVSLHLDHCTDLKLIKKCLDCGWPSVMYDGSSLELEKNIENTRKVVNMAKKKGASVEGEIGRIEGAEDGAGANKNILVKVSEAEKYVKKTEVDCLAIGIGTKHGVYVTPPRIDYYRLCQVNEKVRIPLVLHGGSGLPDRAILKCIHKGIRKINISTEIKLAYETCLNQYLSSSEKFDSLNLQGEVRKAISKKVKEKIILLSLNKRGEKCSY